MDISFVFILYGYAIENILLFSFLHGVDEEYATHYNVLVLFLVNVTPVGVLGDFTIWISKTLL